MTARAEPVRRWQAHPRRPTAHHAYVWPRRRTRLRYAALVVAQTAFLLGLMGTVLAFGLVLGAAVGVDVGPVR
jgi:hypothetical protein